MPIAFLKNWTIDISKIPIYTAFKAKVRLELNYSLLHTIATMDSDPIVFTKERLTAMQPILENINKCTNILETTHSQRFDLGRFYPNDNISPIVLSRHIKHTLFSNLDWIDIDMVKGHVTILYELSKYNNVILPSFKRYIDDFQHIVDTIIKYYSTEHQQGLSLDNVKNLFVRMIYGGGFSGWIESIQEDGIVFKTTDMHPFIDSFKKECDNLINWVYLNNSSITEKIKGSETCEYKLKNKTMAYFCQIIENEIIHIVYKVLYKNKIIKPKSFALEYDGICFKRPEATIDLDEALEEVNATILSKTGLNVIMKWKPYLEQYVHTDIIYKLSNEPTSSIEYLETIIAEETLDTCETYQQFKNVFEKNHFKCRSTAMYYKEDRYGCRDSSMELVLFSEQALRVAYRDYNYELETKTGKRIKYYINDWIDDRTMRVYEGMRCVPPPLTCPSVVYNTWVPFVVTTLTALEKDTLGNCIIPEDDRDEIEARYTFVCNHMLSMCNYDPVAYEYLKYWIAFLLSYPAEKSSMPNIIGSPGSGKSEMVNFIISLIGESRCLVTSKPQDDVWGTFNSLISNKYLIILEELSEKQTTEYEGTIKDLISGGRLTINTKGIKQYKIDSYLKFIALSNTVTCRSISGDRRNVLIKCSDEHIGDADYFAKLREYQTDKRIQMLFYERLLQLPDLSGFRCKPIPLTIYQKKIQNSNREDYDLFMEDWISANTNTEVLTIQSSTLYGYYVLWVKANDVSMKPSSHKKFILNISLLFDSLIQTSIRTKKCNMLMMDIPKIMKRYNIALCTTEVVETEESDYKL